MGKRKKVKRKPTGKVMKIYSKSLDDIDRLIFEICAEYTMMGCSAPKCDCGDACELDTPDRKCEEIFIEVDHVNQHVVTNLIKELDLKDIKLVTEIKH